MEDFARHMPEVQAFVRDRDSSELRALRVRIEDKGPIMTFHWRGAPDEEAAHARVRRIAEEAEAEGLWTHWGRKVLEIRPPGADRQGPRRARAAGAGAGARRALRGRRRDRPRCLRRPGGGRVAVRVGVRSDEGPREIVEQADLVVDGIAGHPERARRSSTGQ